MHAIDTRLRIALGRFEAFLGSDLTADDRQLIHSTAVALEAIEGKVTLPRHHVLQTIRAFVGEMEQTTIANAEIDEARNAYADLCKQWGVLHPGGNRPSASPRPAHAAALAEHLATLIEFHHDDEGDEQHADPNPRGLPPARTVELTSQDAERPPVHGQRHRASGLT